MRYVSEEDLPPVCLKPPRRAPIWCRRLKDYTKEPEYYVTERRFNWEKRRIAAGRTTETQVSWRSRRRHEKFDVRRKAWLRGMTKAVAYGYMEPWAAKEYGWDEPIIGDAWTGGREGWGKMPDVLYHVTTAKDAVLKFGLRSRNVLKKGTATKAWNERLKGGTGLGGGAGDRVSFTDDPKIAKDIRLGVLETIALGQGKLTPTRLWKLAERGAMAKKPYLGHFAQSLTGEFQLWAQYERGFIDGPPEVLRVLERGKHVESIYVGSGEYRNPEGEARVPEVCQRVLQDAGSKSYVVCEPRTGDKKKRNEQLLGIYNSFARARHLAEGPQDAYIVDVDLDQVAQVHPKQVAVLEVTPCPWTHGKFVGTSLREWEAVPKTVKLWKVNGNRVEARGKCPQRTRLA